jgi:hypothetical protein
MRSNEIEPVEHEHEHVVDVVGVHQGVVLVGLIHDVESRTTIDPVGSITAGQVVQSPATQERVIPGKTEQ